MSLSVRHLLHTLLQHAPRIGDGGRVRTTAAAPGPRTVSLTQVTQIKPVKTHPALAALASLDVLAAAYPDCIQIDNNKLVILLPSWTAKGQTQPLSAIQQTRRGLALDIALFLGTQPNRRQTFGVIHDRFRDEMKALGIKDASSLVPEFGDCVEVENSKKRRTPMLVLRKGVGKKAPIDLSSVVRWWSGEALPTAKSAILAFENESSATSFFTSNTDDNLIVRANPLDPTPLSVTLRKHGASPDPSTHADLQPPNDMLSLLAPLALRNSSSPPPPPDLILPNRSLVWKITTPKLAQAASRSLLDHMRPIAIDVDGTVDSIQVAHQPLSPCAVHGDHHPGHAPLTSAWSIVYVFDVRGLGNPLDIVSPLKHVLNHSSLRKVWHAGSNDLRRLSALGLAVYGPVSDTQQMFSEWVQVAHRAYISASRQSRAGAGTDIKPSLPDFFFAHSLGMHALRPPQHVLDALAATSHTQPDKLHTVGVALNTMLLAAGVHLNRRKPKPAGWRGEHEPAVVSRSSGAPQSGWLESKAGDVDQLVQAEWAMRWRIERLKRLVV